MSYLENTRPVTLNELARMRAEGEKIAVLTCYDASFAALLARCGVDVLLVGDSLGNVLQGQASTLPVTLEQMAYHTGCVARGLGRQGRPFVVADMPFGSYQESREAAFRNAARLLKETGCAGVKLEGGTEMSKTVSYLAQRGIPVMGHIGLQPQSVHTLGGYQARGHENSEAKKILKDGQDIAAAGAFSIVLEGIAEPLAAAITAAVPVPTIGIGASAACDGQILVTEDMLGLTAGGKKPKFVKSYADLSPVMEESVKQYAQEVRRRKFPSADYVYAQRKVA